MTRLQLRRLALQATRRPELLPVLQDALLESAAYGSQFEAAIRKARNFSARVNRVPSPTRPMPFAVFFHPANRHVPFTVIWLGASDYDLTDKNSWLRRMAEQGRALVFLTDDPVARDFTRRRRRE